MSDIYPQNPKLLTIGNCNGMSVTIMDWGATIISIKVPVKGEESRREVLLGVKDPATWDRQPCYFNATIGRYANRIANNEFAIDGKTYKLNSKAKHCLHGGADGFDKRRFELVNQTPSSLVYMLHSQDGDQGFPGNYELTVCYSVSDDNTLKLQYTGKCDKACYSCITNHAYFNLNGRNSCVLNHTLWLDSKEFLPCDGDSIPTGEVLKVAGTDFDFTTPKKLGRDFMQSMQQRLAHGYDHPFLISGNKEKPFAKLTSDDGKLSMEVFSDYPAVQIYSGNYVRTEDTQVTARDDGEIYGVQPALCLEPEFYPNAPHLPKFASLNPMVTPQAPLSKCIAYKFS